MNLKETIESIWSEAERTAWWCVDEAERTQRAYRLYGEQVSGAEIKALAESHEQMLLRMAATATFNAQMMTQAIRQLEGDDSSGEKVGP